MGLRRSQAGGVRRLNRDELICLVHQHQVEVYRYLRYLGAAPEVAEDLAQETFLAAWERSRRGPAEPIARPAAWLRGVSRNLFLAHCRRQKASPVRVDSESLERAEMGWLHELDGTGGIEDYLGALRSCVRELPDRQRQIIELQYVQKRSRAQIAAEHGLTEDGVKTLLRRVRAGLAQCVQRRLRTGGITSR